MRIKDGAEFLYEGVTAADGSLYLHLTQVVPPGTYDLYINANNFYSYHTQVTFEASSGPYAACNPVLYVDADGLHHTGEELGLTVTVSNVGQQDQNAAGILTLSCASPNVLILTANCGFGPLESGESQLIEGVFAIELTGEFEDTSQVQLVFSAAFDEISTESHAWLTLNAPQLALSAYQASNPAWHIEPGDSPQLTLYLANQGTGYAYSPVLDLSCDDPHAELSTHVLYPSQLAPQSGMELSNAFSLEISDTAPLDTPILIDYTLDAENGDADPGVIKVYVSRSGYHFENSWMGFAAQELASGFVNQWHRSQSRNHSVNGSCAMKFGGPLLGNYGSSAYGALTSPSLSLGSNATLRFHHWMDAELDADTGYAWDGGLVQISVEGGAWQPLTPLGGYPCLIRENPASPFAANTPVYSGSFDWTEAVFDLSAYSGNAAFRWIFGSDSSVTGAGWYIDDVSLDHDPPLPVELSSFTASVNNAGQIALTWVTQSEYGVLGYRVLRHTAPEPAAALAVSDLIPACNSTQQQLYIFVDDDAETPGWYHYWLLQADLDGGDCYYGPISIEYTQLQQSAPGLPLVTGLDAAYPNPFNARLFLPYALAGEELAVFRIYNQRGQLVRVMDVGRQAPGRYRLEWDGKDDSNRDCGSGVYRIVMQAGKERFQRQAVLLK